MKIILASASPRRKELLKKLVPEFDIQPASGEECADLTLPPEEIVRTLAEHKAEEVFALHPEALVLGADTIVWFGGKLLGKPKDAQDAKDTLRALSGRRHSVFTGWCILGQGVRRSGACRSDVLFHELSESFIDEYVAGGSPLDKAGSYGIQDDERLVARYEGSYDNIIGLPTEELRTQLRGIGVLK